MFSINNNGHVTSRGLLNVLITIIFEDRLFALGWSPRIIQGLLVAMMARKAQPVAIT